MLGGEHFVIRVSTYPFGKEADREFTNVGNDEIFPAKKDTMIGNDVWVGRNVTILSGVNIGDGAVIGAGAVVSKDIPPYAIAVGNPIRILRYRFNKDIIAALQMISWWDWSDEKINDMLPLIMSDEPEKLIFACLGQNWREKIVEK